MRRVALAAALAAGPVFGAPLDYQPIPGVSPEPIHEGAGLRGKDELEHFLDGVMAAHLKAQKVAGATLSVVKDGKLYFAKGYGFANVEKRIPVDAALTLFEPASISKLFTWTAIMQLVEQGKVALDADVNTYLTQFKIPNTYPQPVTIKHLLTHTAGFEDGGIGYDDARSEKDLLPLARVLGEHIPARVRPPQSDFARGDQSSYSNYGASLAGLVVANVAGMSFEDYVDKHIFAPLGMTSSTFRQPLPGPLAARLATGYSYEEFGQKAQDFAWMNTGPAGNLSSTATDMAKFMIAHLQHGEYNGARILKAETAKLMHARALSPNPHVNGDALGFYETWINGRRLIGHGGDLAYFHSDLWLLPEDNLGVFVSYNSASASIDFSMRDDLIEAFMERYYPARVPAVKPSPDFAERAAKYAGHYRVNRHAYSNNQMIFSPALDMVVTPTEQDTLVVKFSFFDLFADQYVEVAPSVFRSATRGHTVAFVEDGEGNVTDLVGFLQFHPAYKLRWHETFAWHLFVLGFAVLLSSLAIVSALRNWRSDVVLAPVARHGRRLAGLLGAINLAFLLTATLSILLNMDELFFGWPTGFYVALALPLLAIPLVLAVLWVTVQAWRQGFWTRYARLQYTALAAASVAFLLTLNFFNLVGYRFG
jgi:CubicO group peptidase (beta-lactamase class C family)